MSHGHAPPPSSAGHTWSLCLLLWGVGAGGQLPVALAARIPRFASRASPWTQHSTFRTNFGYFANPAPAGVLIFMPAIMEINWQDITEAIPAFISVLGMAFTHNIAYGEPPRAPQPHTPPTPLSSGLQWPHRTAARQSPWDVFLGFVYAPAPMGWLGRSSAAPPSPSMPWPCAATPLHASPPTLLRPLPRRDNA